MCFSPTASFSAGVALSAIGILSLRRVEKPRQIMFASIPFVFALQQITEGVLWLSLTDSSLAYLKDVSMYLFMVFAQIIWPIWVPLSILLLEDKRLRQKLLFVFTGIGLVVSMYLTYCLMAFPLNATIADHHIQYQLDYPMGIISKGVTLYFLAIIFTPFFSGINKMWLVGLLVLTSFSIAKIFYVNYVISVWCFFAAIISLVVLYMMPRITAHHLDKAE